MSSEEVRAFGREIRRRRIALNLSLDMLAGQAGLTANYLGSVESGKRSRGLSLAMAFRIAKGLGTDLPDLVGGYKGLSGEGIEAGRLLEVVPAVAKRPILDLLHVLPKLSEKRQR